jgi:hypothetical protein
MPNYNTIVTPAVGLPCTEGEANDIGAWLAEVAATSCGFVFLFEDGLGYLEAEESGEWAELPAEALARIGTLITRAGLPYLECGVAFTCSRLLPGSHGGTAFRILADGTLVDRIETWPPDGTDGQ